jgi:hypothetical protein
MRVYVSMRLLFPFPLPGRKGDQAFAHGEPVILAVPPKTRGSALRQGCWHETFPRDRELECCEDRGGKSKVEEMGEAGYCNREVVDGVVASLSTMRKAQRHGK